MKITNPISRNRFGKKERMQRYLTRKISNFKLKEQKGNNFLSSIYWGLKSDKLSQEDVSIPDDIQVDLLTITVADIMPVEELEEFKDGMKKLLSLYRPAINFNDSNRVDDFYEKISSSIHGKRWSHLGNIQFDDKTDIGKYIKFVSIKVSQISSSIFVVNYQLRLTTDYIARVNNIISSNFQKETIFKPKIKTILKFWGSATSFPEQVKNRCFEDYILEIKWKFFSHISKYLPTFFHKNRVVSPGVLLYKVKQDYCSLNNNHRFWDSVGLPQGRHSLYDMTVDGAWQLHSYRGIDRNLDDSISIVCNSQVKFDFDLGHNIENEIIFRSEDFIRNMITVLAIRRYTIFISKQIATFRISSFRSISKKKIDYKKIIKQRFTVEQNGHMLKRIKNEISLNHSQYLKKELKESFYQWESVNTMLKKRPLVESQVDNTIRLVEDTFNHSESLINTLDNTVQILTLKTNFSLQRRTVLLTIVTIILAVVAIYLTYYQITQETPIEIFDNLVTKLTNIF